MLKKIQITTHGIATIFHKDALQFVRLWKEPMRVHEGWIHSVERVAACCPLWPRHMTLQDFGNRYFQEPDLTAALLNFLRKKWRRLANSKTGQLKIYLSQYPVVKWDPSFNSPAAVKEAEKIAKFLAEKEPKISMVGGAREATEADWKHLELSRTLWANRRHSGPVPDKLGNVPIWNLLDKQIPTAINKLPWGKGVQFDDVVKARKWVVANQRRGREFAKQVLDKDGFLQVKGKLLPRKRVETLQ